ncbi:hypothetical protein ABTK03_20975, partial [Acinetobacter baumannii]
MRLLFGLLLITLTAPNFAQNIPGNLDKLIDEETNKIISWRRYFHENPELSNREFNTCKKIEA